ncbi:MAG: NAD(P)H-hydrate epimerase, partial [Armatimonadetes bacterium]|nr:NAD(P)H-hydrate epimerase [Armatimonadota bacterium]
MAIPVVTSEQMRTIDQEAAKRGLPTVVLMENAGRSVAEAVQEAFGCPDTRVLVLAGRGNNGGDGMVAARYLTSWGYRVGAGLLCPGDELKGDAAIHFSVARNYGVEVIEDISPDHIDEWVASADVVVDA